MSGNGEEGYEKKEKFTSARGLLHVDEIQCNKSCISPLVF